MLFSIERLQLRSTYLKIVNIIVHDGLSLDSAIGSTVVQIHERVSRC